MRDLDPSFARELLLGSRTAIVVCDAGRRAVLATPHALRLLGAHALRDLEDVVAADSLPGVLARLGEVVASRDASRSVFGELRTRSDPPRILEFEATALTHPGRAVVAVTLHDVTQHHARADELWRRSTTDPLTGLANHGVFMDRLTQATRSAAPGQLAMLDLDHFKAVNDRWGHGAGDDVLREVGRRLLLAVPESLGATVARVGGEEFAVLLPGCGEEQAAELVQGSLDALGRPHEVGVVTASAGLASVLHRRAEEAPMAAAESVRRADQALYAAKAAGRARLLVYSDSLRAERATAAQLAALRRENAALARESRTDALTGAGNRRGFDEDLAAMDARVAQRGAPFAVMFLDLDEFGLVNKIWNHQAGNHTLTETAAAIRGAIRSGDALYRYGGEEFVVLLPDATRDGALAVCERVREGLARRALANPGEDHREHRDRLQQRRRG